MSERIMSDEFDGLDATEKTGIRAALIALIRCRALAAKIANELRNERPEHFVANVTIVVVESLAKQIFVSEGQTKGSVDDCEHPW